MFKSWTGFCKNDGNETSGPKKTQGELMQNAEVNGISPVSHLSIITNNPQHWQVAAGL